MLNVGQELIHTVNKDTGIYLGFILGKDTYVKYRGEILKFSSHDFPFEPIKESGEIIMGNVVKELQLEGYYFGLIMEEYWEYIPDNLEKLVEKITGLHKK